MVYIPYFVLSEVDPDNQQAVEGIEHFCTVPAVVNADKVIVQSEDMKKVYVNIGITYASHSGSSSAACQTLSRESHIDAL